jgi:hypothetical protein
MNPSPLPVTDGAPDCAHLAGQVFLTRKAGPLPGVFEPLAVEEGSHAAQSDLLERFCVTGLTYL